MEIEMEIEINKEKTKIIIGIGNKARQGKDTLANCIKEIYPDDVEIIHWADALYDEVRNADRRYPLITSQEIQGRYFYCLLNDQNKDDRYDVYEDTFVPFLDKLFEERKITEYKGMDEKDPAMLQFWGTEYRRAQNKDYWVLKTMKVVSESKKRIIIIPDTRFFNEYNAIQALGGIYIEVARFSMGCRFIDENRDPKHRSETELDDVKSDYAIINNGTLDEYKLDCKNFFKSLRI